MNNIIKAQVTEKSLSLAAKGQYTFRVRPGTSKGKVAVEVHRLYKVDPIDVHLQHIPGKVKTRGRFVGKRSAIHKAIVRLKDNQKIAEFNLGEQDEK